MATRNAEPECPSGQEERPCNLSQGLDLIGSPTWARARDYVKSGRALPHAIEGQ